jgi:hypothetical protein
MISELLIMLTLSFIRKVKLYIIARETKQSLAIDIMPVEIASPFLQ